MQAIVENLAILSMSPGAGNLSAVVPSAPPTPSSALPAAEVSPIPVVSAALPSTSPALFIVPLLVKR